MKLRTAVSSAALVVTRDEIRMSPRLRYGLALVTGLERTRRSRSDPNLDQLLGPGGPSSRTGECGSPHPLSGYQPY